MKVSGICLSVCLLLATRSQEVTGDSHGGRMSETLGEITFECRRGWEIYQGDCYLYVDKPMTAPDALATCHSVSALPWIDQVDYFNLPAGLHISGKIWTGLWWNPDDDSWYYDDKPYSAEHIPYWNDYQPNNKDEQACTVRDSDGLAMEMCENKHPFVCTYPACPQGFMRCARDKRCISREKDICDGINDCSDRSDEMECPDKCRHYEYLEMKTGSIDFPTLTSNLDCTYELEAHIGETIKLTIQPMNGEPNIMFIEVMSYNPVDQSYKLQKQLTGSWSSNQVVYSDQNVLIVRVYRSGVGSTPPTNTKPFKWTTDIPELFGLKDVTALTGYQSLDIPFGRPDDPAPASYELYWDIKAPKVISFNLGIKDETMGVSGQIPFSFFDGEYMSGSMYTQMALDTYYISGTSMLRVKLNMAAGMTRNVYVEYKEGCDLNILESDGTILSPGYSRGKIPHDLECNWTMTKGNTINPDRGMTVTFSEIDLEVDSRDATYKDSLEVFTDGSTEPVQAVQVQSTIHSSSGRLKIKFTSDSFLESTKFKAYFGTDCEALDLSDSTNITPDTTYSIQAVTLSCPAGYEFNREHYKSQSQLTITCYRDDWYDIDENKVIIPQCQIKNCGTPTPVNNGYIVSATGSTFGSTVVYDCDSGFNMTGSSTAECSATGKWINTPECKFASCLALQQSIIPRGKFEIIEGNEFSNGEADFGTIIEFSCDPGYELIGWPISHCNQSGWTHEFSTTPICKRLRCTLPEVENGFYASGVSEVEFEDTKVVRCNTGYKLTSEAVSETITCQANQTFDKEPACEDIDECAQNSDSCQDSTDCVNTIGSYLCNCKSGYERSSRTSCTDINECATDDICFHDCSNSPAGSYTCRCRAGYDLFTQNGLHGFYTSNQLGLVTAFGDNYELNYTCVPQSCPQLENPENGKYGKKIDNKLFYVGDTVELLCNDGYRITGQTSKSASQTCLTGGAWSNSRTCSAMSCSVPTPPLNGEYTPASGPISFGETLALNCTLRANEYVIRMAKCIIDPENTATQAQLAGDNINACPEIDCGNPNDVSPGGANTFSPTSTKHLNDNSMFTFSCGAGYDEIGSSEEGDASMEVHCKANGKWGFGTLSCDGKKCPDPGTPGGAWQNVTSYEIGQKLKYVCDMDGKSGFAPLLNGVEREYTCDLNLAGEGEWCCGLGKTNLPVCTDVTDPVITGCPENPIQLYPMDKLPAFNLAASDNFGVKSFTSNSDVRAGDTVLSSQTITYTATDFQGLSTTCDVVIRVIDIAADKPTLSCPDNIQVTVKKDVTSININDTYGTLITSNGEVTISPTMVYPSLNKIGEHDVINVKATNEFGLESSCTFLVNYPEMDFCDQAAIYPDDQRQGITFTETTNGGMSATGTCRSGYVYKTGENTKVFTCTPSTGWTYDPDDIFCLQYTNPTTGFDAVVHYKLNTVARTCLDPFTSNIRALVGTIKSQVEGLSACSGTNWDISSSAEGTTSDLVTLQATLSFSHGSLSAEQRDACWSQIRDNQDVFLFANSISCGAGAPNTVTVSEIFAISSPELKCAADSYYFTTSTDLGQICIPCGPGYRYDAANGCTQCGVDQYTTLTNQYTCETCPNGADATAIRIECKGTCPAGYYSSTGMFPCDPCPVNTYWTDSKTCTPCPSSGSTLGVEGARDESACHARCEAGQFSRTGYTPCSSCGNHFFTPLQAQTQCSECPGSQTTTDSTIATTSECVNLPADPSDHRMSNRSTSGFVGNVTFLNDQTLVNSLSDCEAWCLAIFSCEEVTYFDDGSVKLCISYPSGVALVADNDAVAAVHMKKERDLVCDRGDCNNNGDCELVYHRRHCTCDEGYKGELCQTFINICDLRPCLNGGVCVESGTFNQYECTCPNDRSKYVMRTSTANGNQVADAGAAEYIDGAVGRTKSQCEALCIATENCEVAAYAVRNDGSTTCGLYGSNPPLATKASSIIEYTYMVKDRSPGEPVGGVNCGTDLVDSCLESECSERSMCMDQVDSYKCLCPVSGGLEGTYCKETDDPCSPDPCQHGSCEVFGAVRYVCTCNPGYEGIDCDIDIDECAMNPGACLNGGTCNNLVDRYTCSCAGNYRGDNCEEVPNFCIGVSCLGDNVCISSNNGGAMCQCDSEYFSTTQENRCEEIASACKANACVNGTCDPTGYDKYAYRCNCDTGSTGSLCQKSRDNCLGVDCNHGTCVDGHMDYTCVCEAGYTGDSCLENINDCAPDPCDADHGRCEDLVDGYECVCEPGFDGDDCSRNIDECLSYPCQHGGTCTDGDNGYTCQCPTGWTGNNCQSEISKCAGTPCNTGKCYSLLDKFVCICGGGTQGDFCDTRNSVCALLDDFDPPLCANGGTCSNVGDSAKCTCKTVPSLDECFFEDGRERTNYEEVLNPNILLTLSREDCQARCLQTAACGSYTYKSADSYCFLHPTTANTLHENEGDTLYVKTCPSDFSGDSCEYNKDWCSDENNPCKNGAQCISNDPIGYTCSCEPGFTGKLCDLYKDPCDSDPCGTSNLVQCQSSDTRHICKCQQGQIHTNGACVGSEKFVILVDNLDGKADKASLQTPFSVSSTAFSIMMWVRVHATQDGFTLLRVIGENSLYPNENSATFEIEVHEDAIKVYYNGVSKALVFKNEYISADMFDGRRHFVGIAINSEGKMSANIDTTAAISETDLEQSFKLEDLNMNIYLGDGVVAEYSRLQVFDQYLSREDFTAAKTQGESYQADSSPVQDWVNWILPYKSRWMNDWLDGTLAMDNSKDEPGVDCPAFGYSVWSEVPDDKYLPISDLTAFSDVYKSLRDSYGSLTWSSSMPSVLEWGRYNAIVMAANTTTGRYSECRAPVYVKYNENCPDYINRDSAQVLDSQCSGNSGVCSVSCRNPNTYSLSSPFPITVPCGPLGVYDPRHPWRTLVLPTCTLRASPKHTVYLKLFYGFSNTICATGVDNIDTVEARLKRILDDINVNWPGICADTACSNFMFGKAACSSTDPMEMEMDIEFSMNFAFSTLQYQNNGITLSITDVFRTTLLAEGKFDLSSVAGAKLLEDEVEISTFDGCDTGNTRLYNSDDGSWYCAPCGKGRYVSNETNTCELCAPGSYQDELNMESCKPCGDDATNYEYGHVSQVSCTEICQAGAYRENGQCLECKRHTYQSQTGKTYCDYCDLGFKTATTGSTSEDDCQPDCPAGEYRTVAQDCKICEPGTWRSLAYDDCQACPDGKTTYDGELAASELDCAMDICDLGAFWNRSEEQCVDCDFGFYNDVEYALSCKSCEGNLTTKEQKSDSSTDCTFYCAAGYEVESSVDKKCKACERGYYKTNVGAAKFDTCTMCSEKTTDDIAITTTEECNVPICEAGEYIAEGVCEACPVDFWSDVADPYTTTQCEPCSCELCDKKGTLKPGANSSDLCMRYCDPGMELLEGQCEMCKRGFYKDNVGEARFQMCKACSDDGSIITDDVGSESDSYCVIPNCKAGQFVFEDNSVYACQNCSKDSYQTESSPVSTVTCTACPALGDVAQGTMYTGAIAEDECKPICPGGKQYDEERKMCTDCPIGQYKLATNRFGTCMACPDSRFTTRVPGADSSAKCDLRDCGPGTYIVDNNGNADCVNCSNTDCEYQEERWQTECKKCGTNLCTLYPGAKSEDDCTIFCGAGLEGTETCEPCKDGYFKSQSGYGQCEECPPGYTSSADDRTACNLRNCWYGTEYVNEGGVENCIDCKEGFYKDVIGNDVTCQQCEPSYTTDGLGKRNCTLRNCLPGTTLKDGDCVECAIGTYKSETGNMACTDCLTNRTTDGTGKTSQAQCDIAICPPGQYRVEKLNCARCPVSQYQPESGKTQCIACEDGQITMQQESTTKDQCVPECKEGQQYNTTTKLCDPCRVGYYKNVVGNTQLCKACESGKTTVGEGSGSSADCSQTVCPAGTYNVRTPTEVKCVPCEIGFYNPSVGKDACEQCLPDYTTFKTGRVYFSDCFLNCAPGSGFLGNNAGGGGCQQCDPGTFNDKKGTNKNLCKKCPTGKTSLSKGSTSCEYDDPTTPKDTFVDVTIILVYKVELDSCDETYLSPVLNAILRVLREVFYQEKLKRYSGNNSNRSYCNSGCANMIVQRRPTKDSCSNRRKRETYTLEVEAIFQNASAVVEDTTDNNQEISTPDALYQILVHNEEELTPVELNNTGGQYLATDPDSGTITTQEVCSAGEVSGANDCTPCPVGMYWEDEVCVKCPKDTYQNQTGQTSCIACPLDKYHDLNRQTSEAACVSYCVSTNYCNNRGSCTSTGRRTASCSCYDDYTGDRCEAKAKPSSDMDVILGLAIGGGGGLLMIILAIVGVYKCLTSKDEVKKKSKRYSANADPEYYPENIYDNYSQSRGLAPFPSVGYPALGYRPDPSMHEDSPYTAVYKNPAFATDANKSSQNEDTFMWTA